MKMIPFPSHVATHIPGWFWFATGLIVGLWIVYGLVSLRESRHHRLRLVISIKCEGATIMAAQISVPDTHAPLQLVAQYVNAKGKVVAAPAGASPIVWKVSDPAFATDAPAGPADVVTLSGQDGDFNVSATDGNFSDTLPITVTPDPTPVGIAISVQNP